MPNTFTFNYKLKLNLNYLIYANVTSTHCVKDIFNLKENQNDILIRNFQNSNVYAWLFEQCVTSKHDVVLASLIHYD